MSQEAGSIQSGTSSGEVAVQFGGYADRSAGSVVLDGFHYPRSGEPWGGGAGFIGGGVRSEEMWRGGGGPRYNVHPELLVCPYPGVNLFHPQFAVYPGGNCPQYSAHPVLPFQLQPRHNLGLTPMQATSGGAYGNYGQNYNSSVAHNLISFVGGVQPPEEYASRSSVQGLCYNPCGAPPAINATEIEENRNTYTGGTRGNSSVAGHITGIVVADHRVPVVTDGGNKSGVQGTCEVLVHTFPCNEEETETTIEQNDSDEDETIVVDKTGVTDEESGSETEGEAEEEYHEVDDEGSDDVGEEGNVTEWISEAKNGEDNVDKSLQYEIVPVEETKSGPYKKRRRFPKGYEVPNERTAREIGVIEKAMRTASIRSTEHIFEPKLGMVFDSRIEAYKFFNLYSWEVGFGIRFGNFAQNRVNKMRTMQQIVCEKQGSDSRCKSSTKRTRCKAMIMLHRTYDMGWYISRHVSEHNHEISVSSGEKREWNSHGKIEDNVKRMITYLRQNNISLSKVHCYVGSMYGRMENIPFNQKSLRAVCTQIAKDQRDDDIGKTLEVFRKMREEDPGFQFSVDLDSENKIKTLLWTSGRSRSQYNYFGDAITFDTTYCTNIYKMPFGMFVGVNNHFQSILFGGVLMKNEDTVSFKWVFKEFVTLMGGKAPVTILTDQCKAMTKAIREVFPDWTTHLWCKWHVLRYAPEEIGTVFRTNGTFRKEFEYMINQMLTVDEFEKAWAGMVKTYGLENNKFMKKTYAKRHKWGKPWAKSVFCARMASTQRSESANMILKKVVPPNSSMNLFVEQYGKMLFLRKAAEQKAEHQTKQFVHLSKRMYPIEKHALSVYTKNCFKLFSEEVDKSIQYDVYDGKYENCFWVIHNNAEARKEWARVAFSVEFDEETGKYNCECGQYEHFGILCCHAIKVLISQKKKKIPEGHIMKRWTRNARDFEYPDEICTSAGEQLGHQLLYSSAFEVVSSTEKNPAAAEILMRHLQNAKKEIEGLSSGKQKSIIVTDGDTTTDEAEATCTESDLGDNSGYDTTNERILNNKYGASGSSAYMSDADIQKIQAPLVPPQTGRRRVKRFKPLFERKRKSRKSYRATDEVDEKMKLNDKRVKKM